ncbi:MAG: peptide-binding protein [Thermosulfidibacteraceae bacterium]|jgi:peptide/nickel transport system substrate-binding protein
MEKYKVITFTILLLLFYQKISASTLTIGSIGEPKRLLPILAVDVPSATISGLVFNGLLKYDGNLNVVGDLAESWEIKNGGKTLVFHLKKNVYWQDGKPFTARDVIFTYKKVIDPKVATPYSGEFMLVKRVIAPNDYTVIVEYKKPYAFSLVSWMMGIMPEHLLSKEDINTSKYNRYPVGTGPFILERWETGRFIELRANPNYHGGKPKIDRIIYRIIPDSSTMFMELKAGKLDYMNLSPFQYSRQFNNRYLLENFVRYRYPSFSYTYLGLNIRLDIFKDKRVRKALCYAIDREMIVKVVLLGFGSVSNGIFPPSSLSYNPNVKPFPYDPKKALSLLREAGWKLRNGMLMKDGKPFEFTIITNQGNNQRIAVAEIIQYQLKRIGIKVNIRVLEWQALLRMIEERNFQAVLLGWSTGFDSDPYDIWHSSKTGSGEFNFIGYKNEEVDRLLELGRTIFDPKRKKEIYGKVQELIYEDQPYVFLYVPDNLVAVHKKVKGIELKKAGIIYNIEKWRIEE